mmetsp:Transcript_72779/g.226851  ORF Transcript_72779/g.226851 Transcript_72779/m.226851 type:complete len:157 (-) Transcript_72779:94-564(-)
MISSVQLVVEGIDYVRLSANAFIFDNFRTAVKASLAAFFQGVTKTMVSVVLSAGSVRVAATVIGKGSSSDAVRNMTSSLQSASVQDSFSQLLVEQVRAVPSIAICQSGAVAVSGVNATVFQIGGSTSSAGRRGVLSTLLAAIAAALAVAVALGAPP